MTDSKFSRYALIAFPWVLLLGDILQTTNHSNIAWTIFLAIGFLLFVGGMPAINVLIQDSNPKFRLIINVFLLVGAMAGASMQVFFRVLTILENAKLTEAVEVLSMNPALPLSTMVPGIFFPFGLILLGTALFLSKKYPNWKVILLLMGAILFPVGHAAGNAIALITGDLVLVVAWLVLNPEIAARQGGVASNKA